MKKREINQLKVGVILSYIQMALGIIIGIVYTPLMLQLLGKSEYGLYNTVAATISMLSLLNMGFSSSYIRFYSQYKANKDNESIDKLNGLFILIFGFIALIALFCGLFLSNNLEMIFDEGLTQSEYSIASKLMIVLSFNLAIGFISTVFQCIISAHERFVFLKGVSIIRTVISPLVTLPLLLLGFRSVGMVVVTLCLSVITDVIYFCCCIFKLKVRFRFRGFEKGIFKSIFTFTGFIAINMIVDQINFNMDKLLLGRFIGTESVAVYSIGFVLYQYYTSFSTSISGVFTPRVHRIIQENESNFRRRQLLTDLFVKVGRIQFILLALLASGIIFFGKSFIQFWAGEGYEEAYFVALLLILPATIPLIQNVGIEIQRALNKHKFRSICYLIMAFINLYLSINLCQKYGTIGAAIGTTISLLIANGVLINIYYHRKCDIDIIFFWKNILSLFYGLIIPILSGIVIISIVQINSLGILVIIIIGYTLIYCLSMYLFGMNNYEQSLIKNLIVKILKKYKLNVMK